MKDYLTASDTISYMDPLCNEKNVFATSLARGRGLFQEDEEYIAVLLYVTLVV